MENIISVPVQVPTFVDGEVKTETKMYPFCWGTGAYFASELAKDNEQRESQSKGFANANTLDVFKGEDPKAVETLRNFSDVARMYYDGLRFGCQITGTPFDLRPEHVLDAMNEKNFAEKVYEYMQLRTLDFQNKKKELKTL